MGRAGEGADTGARAVVPIAAAGRGLATMDEREIGIPPRLINPAGAPSAGRRRAFPIDGDGGWGWTCEAVREAFQSSIGRRRSRVKGNSGLTSAGTGRTDAGVCPMRKKREARRASASAALTGKRSKLRPPGWATW